MRSMCQTSRAALIALLASMPAAAVAQEETLESTTEGVETGVETTIETVESGAESAAESVESGAQSVEGSMETGAESIQQTTEIPPTAAGETVAEQEQPAQPVEGQITMQDDNSILATDLMGATVYSSNDETVGDIDNLIVNLDGSIEGIVIGVGGFLGIGEKQVAVQMSSLSVSQEESGQPRLVSSATKADLEAAPEFVTAAEQQSEQDAPVASEETGVIGTEDAGGTAPVEGTATTEGGLEIEN